MDGATSPSPRDSRMEQFSIAAADIIFAEKGLSPIAQLKIQSLAKQKHISHAQMTECLKNISHRAAPWERVGRYEQIFLDRLGKEFVQDSASILTPQRERTAIKMATKEYQIPSDRAHQLLDHFVEENGISRISKTDAKSQLRSMISDELMRVPHRQSGITDRITRIAQDFGIDEADVKKIVAQELETGRRQTTRWRRLMIGVVIATGIVALAGGTVFLTSRHLGSDSLSSWGNQGAKVIETMPERKKASPTQTLPPPQPNTNPAKPAGLSGHRVGPQVNADTSRGQTSQTLASTANDETVFNANELLDAIVSKEKALAVESIAPFERWRWRLLRLIQGPGSGDADSEDFPQPNRPSFSDSNQKQSAMAGLRSPATKDREMADALERLSALAETFEDVSPSEAELLSRFVVDPPSEELKLTIETTIEPMGNWPQFLFALSDVLRENEPNSQWHQRVVFSLTGGSRIEAGDLWQSVFEMGRLKIKARRLALPVDDAHEELRLGQLILDFATKHIPDRSHQNYIERLIEGRDRRLGVVARKIVLQQILIDAFGFANCDTKSLREINNHGAKIGDAQTIGQQLEICQTTLTKLSLLHLERLPTGSLQERRFQSAAPANVALIAGRNLRDQAEAILIAGGGVERATEKYLEALDCQDLGIVRGSLKGLMGIVTDQSKRRLIQRRADFLHGGSFGPGKFLGPRDFFLSPPQLQTVVDTCRAIRSNAAEKSRTSVGFKNDELETAFRLLATQRPPLSSAELEFIVQLESSARSAIDNGLDRIAAPSFPQSIEPELSSLPIVPLLISSEGLRMTVSGDR